MKLPDPSHFVITSGLTTCPSGLFLHFCHAKHTRKSTIILVGRSVFWHCCCSWLESLGTKLSQPVSQKKQHQGNLPAPYTDGKGTRKFFIGKNLKKKYWWVGRNIFSGWLERNAALSVQSEHPESQASHPGVVWLFGSSQPWHLGQCLSLLCQSSCNPWNELPSRGTLLSLHWTSWKSGHHLGLSL